MDTAAAGGTEPLARDTDLDVEARQLERWRQMSSVEIARTIRAAWLAGHRIAWMGLRERFPGASDEELLFRQAVERLGPALAARIHPEAARSADA